MDMGRNDIYFRQNLVKYQAIDADGDPVGEPVISGWDMNERDTIDSTAWNGYLTWNEFT